MSITNDSENESAISVLFVCLGNICRSPTAHGIFQGLIDQAMLSQSIFVDSCGTGDWHIGHSPDERSAQAAKNRGYDLSALVARQVVAADFDRFDYIFAMDQNNLNDLQAMTPDHFDGTLALFLPFAEIAHCREVPDPYYGGESGFENVLDLVEQASTNLLTMLKQRHNLN